MTGLEHCEHDKPRWYCAECNPPEQYVRERTAVIVAACAVLLASSFAWAVSGEIGYGRGRHVGGQQVYDAIDQYAQDYCVGVHKQQEGSGAHMDMMTLGGVPFYCRDDGKGYYRPHKKDR